MQNNSSLTPQTLCQVRHAHLAESTMLFTNPFKTQSFQEQSKDSHGLNYKQAFKRQNNGFNHTNMRLNAESKYQLTMKQNFPSGKNGLNPIFQSKVNGGLFSQQRFSTLVRYSTKNLQTQNADLQLQKSSYVKVAQPPVTITSNLGLKGAVEL